MEKSLPILLSNSMWFSSFCSFFNTSFNYWVLGLPPSSITTLTVMLAALNFVLGASIRRLWALRTQRKSIERDVCAPVVLAHQHVVAPIWVQRDPERINHNHKSRSIGYKPLRSEDEPVHIEGSFCWCWSSREGGVGLVSEWAFWKLKHRTFCLTMRCFKKKGEKGRYNTFHRLRVCSTAEWCWPQIPSRPFWPREFEDEWWYHPCS